MKNTGSQKKPPVFCFKIRAASGQFCFDVNTSNDELTYLR